MKLTSQEEKFLKSKFKIIEGNIAAFEVATYIIGRYGFNWNSESRQVILKETEKILRQTATYFKKEPHFEK